MTQETMMMTFHDAHRYTHTRYERIEEQHFLAPTRTNRQTEEADEEESASFATIIRCVTIANEHRPKTERRRERLKKTTPPTLQKDRIKFLEGGSAGQ